MNHELTLAFPLAVHERQDVELSTAQDFLEEARRRMTVAAMVTEGDVCTHGVPSLISDAIELTRAADAKSAGKKVTLASGEASLRRLADLAQAILCATAEMATLDEVELEAINDLLLALTSGLERHAACEDGALVGASFKSVAEVAAAQVLADRAMRSKRPARGKRAERAAAS